jgi:site-specific DNA-adenine methylase
VIQHGALIAQPDGHSLKGFLKIMGIQNALAGFFNVLRFIGERFADVRQGRLLYVTFDECSSYEVIYRTDRSKTLNPKEIRNSTRIVYLIDNAYNGTCDIVLGAFNRPDGNREIVARKVSERDWSIGSPNGLYDRVS